MDSFKIFCEKYGGSILGGLIGIALSIILFCTNLYKVLFTIALIIVCVWAGNYIQKNKDNVKEKTKNFIDKL